MKFLLQGKPLNLLAKLCFALLLISAAAYAANEYWVSIDCSDSTNCYEIDGQPVTSNMTDVIRELSTGQLGQRCNNNNGNIECDIGQQQTLTCTESNGDITCNNGSDVIMSCFYLQDSCNIELTESICTNSPSSKALCGAMLPQSYKCDYGLPSCSPNQPNAPGTTTIDLSISAAIQEACLSEQYSFEFCQSISGPDAAAVINALTPENLDLASDTTITSQTQLFSLISRHLQQLRQNPTPIISSAQNQYYFDDRQQGFLPEQLWAASSSQQNDALSDQLDSVISLSHDGRLSMYVNASYLRARQDLSELEGKSKSYVAMLTTGLDYRLSQGVVGGAVSFADGSTKYGRNDSEFDSKNYNATVYGSFYKKQWWLDGAVSYGLNRFNQQRDISCTSFSCAQISNIYYADYNGSTLSAQVASGYDFVFGRFSVSPFAQWQIGTVKTDAYSEKARFTGPTATIAIDEQSRDFSTASLGSYLRYSFATKKAVLVPYLRLLFNHELKDDAQYISGRLVGAANSDFLVRANDRDSNYATIEVGS